MIDDPRLPDRFWAKVHPVPLTGCWLWAGGNVRGYGHFFWAGKTRKTHRVTYEEFVGPIPDGLHIDHLCRVPQCCNPDHLEAVTCRENLLRGDTWQARNARKTNCPAGHPYDAVHTYRRKGGGRSCLTCINRRSAEARAKRKAV